MPTLRVPTVAISNDASKGDLWKAEVLRSVGEFPMFVLRGHETKYDTHASLLGSVV